MYPWQKKRVLVGAISSSPKSVSVSDSVMTGLYLAGFGSDL